VGQSRSLKKQLIGNEVRGQKSWERDKVSRSEDESHREKGVAELRSSVIRVNGRNDSPTRRREKEGEKENWSCWVEGEEQGTI
jgi:hypothetical protein